MKSLFGARKLKLRDAGLVAYRAASDLVGKGAFLLVTVVAARRLSQEEFGLFSLASTVGWIAAIATDFGSQLHLARAIAREPRRAGALLRGWTIFRLGTSAAALFVTCAVVLAWPAARPHALAMVLLTAMYIVSGLVEFLHYFYRGLSRSDVESTLTLAQRLGTLVLAVAVLWTHPGVTLLAAAMLVPVVVTWSFSMTLAFSMAGGSGERLSQVTREWARDVMPIGAGIVLSALYFRVDVFLVEFWNGTGAVALYNAAFRLVEALRLFPAAIIAVALPVICRATNAKPVAQLSTIVTGMAVIGSIVVAAMAPWLVPFLYGAAYAPAVTAFRILLIAFPLMSLNYALTHQLIGWDGHRAYAWICAAALVFNVGLNALLIPSLSIAGAAWSTVWTEALLSAGCLAALWWRGARAGVKPAVLMEAS